MSAFFTITLLRICNLYLFIVMTLMLILYAILLERNQLCKLQMTRYHILLHGVWPPLPPLAHLRHLDAKVLYIMINILPEGYKWNIWYRCVLCEHYISLNNSCILHYIFVCLLEWQLHISFVSRANPYFQIISKKGLV